MKGNNFLWAVKQMLNGKKVTRKEGFSNSKISNTMNLLGTILCCDKKRVLNMENAYLKSGDYLAEDWILWEKLEEAGAKVVDVTPKTIEEKRLEKISKIFEEIKKDHFKPHPELREAMFEGKVPICTYCGFLRVQEKSGLWKCDNPKCKLDKNIKVSIG